MRQSIPVLVSLVTITCAACAWDFHVGTAIDDPADPGHLALAGGAHAIAQWCGYEVRREDEVRRIELFQTGEGGVRRPLGGLPVDGIRSINEREAVYALSPDSARLLYLHAPPLDASGVKAPGLYERVRDGDERLLVPGAGPIPTLVAPLFVLPADALAYELPAAGPAPSWGALLDGAWGRWRVRTTAGEDLPLLVWGGSAVHRAAFEGDLALLRDLSAAKERETRTALGLTPLHVAVVAGRVEAVRALLAAGAELDACTRAFREGTSLHLAVLCGRTDVAELLLAAGADVNALDEYGCTPLTAVLSMLTSPDAPPDAPFTVLVAEAAMDEWWFNGPNDVPEDPWSELGALLLRSGADPELRTSEGLSALHLAARLGDAALARALLEHGARPDAVGPHRARPLHYAADVEVARVLLQHGASRDARDDKGHTARILAELDAPAHAPARP